jgi:hypothetical protein
MEVETSIHVGTENKTSSLMSYKSEICVGLRSFIIKGNGWQWTAAPIVVLNLLHCEE